MIEGNADTLKMKSFVYGLLIVVMLIGTIISLLAFLLLMISILLLIEKNKEKFINLHSLGYSIRQISMPYTVLVVVANSVVWLSAALVMPKFGMKMLINPAMDAITWYGKGIHENYPDRKSSEFIGEYSLPLNDFVVNYPAPQENGNRCDVRWMSFSDGKLNLRVEGLQPL